MKKSKSRVALVAGSALVAVTLAGCSSAGVSQPTPIDTNAKVTIKVGNMPTTDGPDLTLFKEHIEEFEKAHPNVTIEPETTAWDIKTFPALLAGGTMPTVMNVSLTEMSSLIAKEQVADMTDIVKQLGILDELNPLAVQFVSGKDDSVWGIPSSTNTLALVYNRDLFEQAGLDPDDPPTTWEEVRADAKAITEKTGKTGYAHLTATQGGWILTAEIYSRGGAVTSEDGTNGVLGDEAKDTLSYLHELRWTDNSMGSNFNMAHTDFVQAFAAGDIGMGLLPPQGFSWAADQYGMDRTTIGLSGVPQEGGDNGTTVFGNAQIFNKKATPEQLAAAAEWVQFHYFNKYKNEDAAVADAKATIEAKGTVGLPMLSPLSTENFETYQGWIKDLANVPSANVKPYVDSLNRIPLKTEPAHAQAVYLILNSVVQAVLTDENADIDDLITQANSQIDRELSQ